MKVLLISGTYPPELCGIGDYTEKLADNLKLIGTEIVVLANIDWSLRNYKNVVKQINDINADIIHIQYPSIGYGNSIVPQLLSLKFKSFVTIHEVIQAHPIRKISLLPFSIKADLIFTNEFEKSSFDRMFFWSRLLNKHKIIPIGSNIVKTNNVTSTHRNSVQLIYFGQIRPNKGIEDILELAKLISENQLNYKILVIGQVISKFEQYYNSLHLQSDDLPIEWQINLPEETVSDQLSGHLIAYLPFPDGVSERRGSLLAALANKMLIYTTKGKQTTQAISETVVIVDSPAILIEILKTSSKEELISQWQRVIEKSTIYMKNLDWSIIAQSHLSFYETRWITDKK